jgi:hypothetical protein
MIELPSELQDTVRLVYATTRDQRVQWPDIDEDQMAVHSASWSDAAKTLTGTVETPMAAKGTIWIPTTPWQAGDDQPLDAFVNFWMNFPYMHYKLAAKQASAVSGALNNAAGVIKSYKVAYIGYVQTAQSELVQDWHALGSTHWYSPFSTEVSIPNGGWSAAYGETLQQIAPNEAGGRLAQDQTAIGTCKQNLQNLSDSTHQKLAVHAKIIDQATTVLSGIAKNAQQAVAVLPDQSYLNPAPTEGGSPPSDDLSLNNSFQDEENPDGG